MSVTREGQILQYYQSCDDFENIKPSGRNFKSQPHFGLFGVGLVWDLFLNKTLSEMSHKAWLWGCWSDGTPMVLTWGWEQPDLARVLQGPAIHAVRLPAPSALISCPQGAEPVLFPPPHSSLTFCVYFEKLSAKLFRVVLYCKGKNWN